MTLFLAASANAIGVNFIPYTSVLFALLAAFLFALSAHVQHLGLTESNTRQATLIVIATTAAIHWLVAPFFVTASFWVPAAVFLFILSGLLRPTLSISLWVEGINRLGPTLNAGLSASGPIFAAAFAILLLGEPLTAQVAIGTLAVILGVLISTLRRKGVVYDWPLWAVLLPLGAASFRAAAHAVTKLGFAHVPSPVFSGLVATTVSFLILAVRFRLAGDTFTSSPIQYFWFFASGVTGAIGVFALNSALVHGQVIVVSPIVASSPVFALLLAILVFRREKLTWRTIATIVMVVFGVVLVILGNQTG